MKEFGNIEAFVAHLGLLGVAEHVAEHSALDKCAALVEKRAKEKIGEYQTEAGPFAAWAELADSTKDDRTKQGYSENDPGLRTGQMRDSISRTVDGLEAQIGSDDDKLVYFELGTSKQPPRSVLGGAMAEKVPEIKEILGASLVAALVGQQVVAGGIQIEG